MKGKLFGVSVGPGDWKMMTLGAKEALENCDIICFPTKAKGSSSFALSIIQQAIDISDKQIEELVFSMDPRDEVSQKWATASTVPPRDDELKGGRAEGQRKEF